MPDCRRGFDPDGIYVELRLPVVMEGAERPAPPAAARP